MKSIGVRLAFWYALSSTAMIACLFLAGRYFLEHYAIHGLDLLNQAEFDRLQHRLGPDYEKLPADRIRELMAESIGLGSTLFYVEIRRGTEGTIYRSPNLNGDVIPDHVRESEDDRNFNAIVNNHGELRATAFHSGPFRAVIATSKRQIRTVMIGYEKVFYGLIAVMIVLSTLVGYALSRMALRPVRLIQSTATHIGSDNLSERIPVSPVQDEISNLARLLNEMFDRLEAAFLQTRRFTAEASHELKTPLSLVRLQAEKLMIEGGLKPAQEEAVQVQLEEISRLNQIIEDLLFLSRAEAGAIKLQIKRHSTQKFLESFITDARVLAESRGLAFVDHIEPVGEWDFDPRWLRQVLLNLIANAYNVSPAGGTVTLYSRLAGGKWQIAMEDEGPGVPEAQREKIFERFVRLGTEGTGSGLGLAISRSVVQLHSGVIRAESARQGTGLRVECELPGWSATSGRAGADRIRA